MRLKAPPAVPPRDLEEAKLTHGGRVLTLTVLRQAGKRLRPLTTTYAVEFPPGIEGVVNLVKGDGRAYEVTAHACTCDDAQFKARERSCKHRTSLQQLGLL